jgi:hypothetical protein
MRKRWRSPTHANRITFYNFERVAVGLVARKVNAGLVDSARILL